MPPKAGGPELLYEGLVQASPGGALYIAERTGVPPYSTLFWRPDQPLERIDTGKNLRYRYPTADGGRTLVFVGLHEPPDLIPAGALVRVSLAHWWRREEYPDEELRCFVQLSGYFLPAQTRTAVRSDNSKPVAAEFPQFSASYSPSSPLPTLRPLLSTLHSPLSPPPPPPSSSPFSATTPSGRCRPRSSTTC